MIKPNFITFSAVLSECHCLLWGVFSQKLEINTSFCWGKTPMVYYSHMTTKQPVVKIKDYLYSQLLWHFQ